KRFWLTGLVPKGDAVEQVGSLKKKAFKILRAVSLVFDGEFEGFGKRDRVRNVPTVADAAVARVIALPTGLAEPVSGARAESPGIIEIILTAGALEARDRFTVDVKEVVALAPPAILSDGYRHHGADVRATPFQVRNEIVAPGNGRV